SAGMSEKTLFIQGFHLTWVVPLNNEAAHRPRTLMNGRNRRRTRAARATFSGTLPGAVARRGANGVVAIAEPEHSRSTRMALRKDGPRERIRNLVRPWFSAVPVHAECGLARSTTRRR